MTKLTGVSLFSGVGGFDLAMARNNIDVVATCEIDKKAQGILKKHFPHARLFNDVTEVTGEQLIESGFDPRNGVITGGFPCQDLSVAGRRAGLSGSRSGLFWEIARIIDETKTEFFILENVPGLLSSQDGRDMGVVTETLVQLGYGIAWRILDAQFFGVAQRRRRVFIVGRRHSDGTTAGKILFEPQSLRRDLTESGTAGEGSPRCPTGSTLARMRGFGDYTLDTKASALKARDYKDATDLVLFEDDTSHV